MNEARTYYLPEKNVPVTTALLRHVFGTYRVPHPGQEGYYLEAALLGLDWARLAMSGAMKLPVLCLVGGPRSGRDLFFRWMEGVLRVPVSPAYSLESARVDMAQPRVVLWKGDPSQESTTLLAHLNETREVCLHPDDPARHTHIKLHGIPCLSVSSMPEPTYRQGNYWVRHLGDMDAKVTDDMVMLHLRNEEGNLLDLMRRPMLTRMASEHWFRKEDLNEPLAA